MRILITNNTLDLRAGSELYVRDVAIALLKRGHQPIAYSSILGEVAAELRRATVPVIDDLGMLASPPDIIHGQHHLETMTALLRFPGVPAVFFCHGWLPWEETPPQHPRILRYVAVDYTCKDRIVLERGISEDRVRVIHNFVDLERFATRRKPLPPVPQRALVFSNNANEQTHLGIISEACALLNIELDVVGFGSGNPEAKPEKILQKYDLVFAKARSALEAMAVGCAVIACDTVGCGPMITSGELERLRALNFGIRVLREPLEIETLEREIQRYDAADAAKVSSEIRAAADLNRAVDAILEVYSEVRDEAAKLELSSESESVAVSNYLRWLGPQLKHTYALWEDRIAANEVRQSEVRRKREADRPTLTGENDPVKELNRIQNSTAWKVVSKYGPIKYRYVLPLYQRIKRLLRMRSAERRSDANVGL